MVSACLLCLIVTLRILKKLSIICISKAPTQNDLSLNCDFNGEKSLIITANLVKITSVHFVND